jgi:hypothetical protein
MMPFSNEFHHLRYRELSADSEFIASAFVFGGAFNVDRCDHRNPYGYFADSEAFA